MRPRIRLPFGERSRCALRCMRDVPQKRAERYTGLALSLWIVDPSRVAAVEHQWGVNLSNAPSVRARDVVNVAVTISRAAARTTRCAARNSSVNHRQDSKLDFLSGLLSLSPPLSLCLSRGSSRLSRLIPVKRTACSSASRLSGRQYARSEIYCHLRRSLSETKMRCNCAREMRNRR